MNIKLKNGLHEILVPVWHNHFIDKIDIYQRNEQQFITAFQQINEGYKAIQPGLIPIFFKEEFINKLEKDSLDFITILNNVPHIQFNNDFNALLKCLNYSEKDVNHLLPLCQPEILKHSNSISRIDYMLTDDGPKIVEINVGPTIGGIGILDRYNDIFLSNEVIANGILKNNLIKAYNTGDIWAKLMRKKLNCLSSVLNKHPRIVFACADDEMKVPHPYEAAHYLNKNGFIAEIAPLSTIDFCDNYVIYRNNRLDILYGCLTYDQLNNEKYFDFVKKATACHLTKKVLYFSPPTFTLFGNKGMLAILSDKSFLNKLTDSDQSIINKLLLETKILSEDTYDWAIKEQSSLVLKPVIGNGGYNIKFGYLLNRMEWIKIINDALKSGILYIIQRYVESIKLKMPTSSGLKDYHVCIGAINFIDKLGGLLLRFSPAGDSILNCKQGAKFTAGYVYKFN